MFLEYIIMRQGFCSKIYNLIEVYNLIEIMQKNPKECRNLFVIGDDDMVINKLCCLVFCLLNMIVIYGVLVLVRWPVYQKYSESNVRLGIQCLGWCTLHNLKPGPRDEWKWFSKTKGDRNLGFLSRFPPRTWWYVLFACLYSSLLSDFVTVVCHVFLLKLKWAAP